MTYDKILAVPAPCGLKCRKCMAHADCEIKQHSRELPDLPGPSFDRYGQRFSPFMPVFERYPLTRQRISAGIAEQVDHNRGVIS